MLPGRLPSLPLRHLLAVLALAALLAAPAARANDYADVDRLLRARNPQAALAKAEAYLAGKPRDPQMLFLRAAALSDADRKDEALVAYTRLTEDFPELPEPHNNLAVLHAARGDLDKALLNLQAALRANPDYAVAYENLGDVQARMALQSWARAQKLDPGLRNVAGKLARLREAIAPTPAPAPAAATR
jgi:Flp pilus assembly protein TadD